MTEPNTAVATVKLQESTQELSIFDSAAGFALGQRMAQALVHSDLVPKEYKGPENLGNALIALDMAKRTGSNPVMVMQNLDIIHGRPSWRAQFVIAALNSCGKFSPLRFVMSGEGDTLECFAWAKDASDGERLEGPPVSISMAKKEGWFGKQGSKWQTMPELMIRYRAAAFFGRLYAPQILMGMQTDDEIRDTSEMRDVSPTPEVAPARKASDAATNSDDSKTSDLTESKPKRDEKPAAAAGRGRPSKVDTDAAEEDGRKAKRSGVPREAVPDAFGKPSLKAAWESGWDAEEARPAATDKSGAPFDFDAETGEVHDDDGNDAPAVVEAQAQSAAASDDDGLGFGD